MIFIKRRDGQLIINFSNSIIVLHIVATVSVSRSQPESVCYRIDSDFPIYIPSFLRINRSSTARAFCPFSLTVSVLWQHSTPQWHRKQQIASFVQLGFDRLSRCERERDRENYAESAHVNEFSSHTLRPRTCKRMALEQVQILANCSYPFHDCI